MKKICTKFWFLIGNFRASLRPSLRPSGTACCPREFSKSPPGSGDLGEYPLTKTGIFYINSCKILRKILCKILCKILSKILRKINIENSGFCEGIFTQIPWARRGFWKSSRAGVRRDAPNGGRSGGPRARRAGGRPRVFPKSPNQNSEFCTYFFHVHYINIT